MVFVCINGTIALNVTGNTTGNSSSVDDFNDKMSTYAFYYLYLSAIVLVAGYFQVNISLNSTRGQIPPDKCLSVTVLVAGYFQINITPP
jgi:hypothetical protein